MLYNFAFLGINLLHFASILANLFDWIDFFKNQGFFQCINKPLNPRVHPCYKFIINNYCIMGNQAFIKFPEVFENLT